MSDLLIIGLLQTTIDACSSEAKYFLIRYICELGFVFPAEVNVEKLSKQLQLNRSRTGKAIRELVDAGYLSEETLYENRRGRPKKRYSVTSKLEANPASSVAIPHKNLIMDLLAPDSRNEKGDRRHELKIPGRLLMATLLSLADDRGVVQNAGTASLGEKTGMSVERVRNNIAKLRSLGYVRQVCPGISSKQLFGTIGSAFVLNLKHWRWKKNSSGGYLWLLSFDGAGTQLPTLEAYSLIKLALISMRTHQSKSGSVMAALQELAVAPHLSQLHAFGKRLLVKNPYRLADRLQFQLEMAASAILTEQKEHLSEGNFFQCQKIVDTYIGKVALPETLFRNQEDTAIVLADLFYRVAWRKAQKIFLVLKNHDLDGVLLVHHPIGVRKPSGLLGLKHLGVESVQTQNQFQGGSFITLLKELGLESYLLLGRNDFSDLALDDNILKRFNLGNLPS